MSLSSHSHSKTSSILRKYDIRYLLRSGYRSGCVNNAGSERGVVDVAGQRGGVCCPVITSQWYDDTLQYTTGLNRAYNTQAPLLPADLLHLFCVRRCAVSSRYLDRRTTELGVLTDAAVLTDRRIPFIYLFKARECSSPRGELIDASKFDKKAFERDIAANGCKGTSLEMVDRESGGHP
ncbi:hypothetical protein J6590_051162 [Homalodisca vitripennis]|nr:hypothetical protein J6590_051162 [Homalodisca vitripennis]